MRYGIAIPLILMLGTCVFARSAETESIQNLIQRLNSDDFDEREQTVKALIKRGSEVVEPLKKALGEKQNADFTMRAGIVVDHFEGGGEVLDGLKIKLACNQPAIKAGEKVTFTVSVYNMTEKALNFQQGYMCGNAYVSLFPGGLLRRVITVLEESGVKRELEQHPELHQMRGLPITHPSLITLAPFERIDFSEEVTVGTFGEDNKDVRRERLLCLPFTHVTLKVPQELHRLRVVFNCSKCNDSQMTVLTSSGDKGDPKATCWSGTLRSNDLLVNCEK